MQEPARYYQQHQPAPRTPQISVGTLLGAAALIGVVVMGLSHLPDLMRYIKIERM